MLEEIWKVTFQKPSKLPYRDLPSWHVFGRWVSANSQNSSKLESFWKVDFAPRSFQSKNLSSPWSLTWHLEIEDANQTRGLLVVEIMRKEIKFFSLENSFPNPTFLHV